MGAISCKSATHAIAVECELIDKANKAGISFALYLVDASKAFDNFSRPRACRAMKKLGGKRESVRRLI